MKKFIFSIVWVFSFVFGHSQSDSLILGAHFDSQLSSTNEKIGDGRFAQPFSVSMKKGDICMIKYRSEDFEPELDVINSVGRGFAVHTNKPDTGKLLYTFRPDSPGPFVLAFTSKLPKKSGKMSIDIAYYHSDQNNVTGNSSFCDKLKYIARNAEYNFEFIKSKETFVNLLNGNNTINTGTLDDPKKHVYNYRVYDTSDLTFLKKKFSEINKDVADCIKKAGGEIDKNSVPNDKDSLPHFKYIIEVKQNPFYEGGSDFSNISYIKIKLTIDESHSSRLHQYEAVGLGKKPGVTGYQITISIE